MILEDIELYLSKKNVEFSSDVENSIEKLLNNSIKEENENVANWCWCLSQIFKIQKTFVGAIELLRNQEYEHAWLDFDSADIKISLLEPNFDITLDEDKFHIQYIKNIIKEYQKLFPYHYFISRECIIKSEKCSICGKPISFRKPCGHKVGKLYMGRLCLREVTDFEIKAFCIVKDPFDKYAYIKIPEKKYNYDLLDKLMKEIDSPYDSFGVEIIKIKKPEYKKVGRNAKCPCGSGKKYKRCHLGSKDELMDHYKIEINKVNV